MNALLNAHVGGRLVAIIAGAIALAARTNGFLHAFAGTWFFGSMLRPGIGWRRCARHFAFKSLHRHHKPTTPPRRVTLGMDPVTFALTRAADNGLLPSGASVLLAVSGGADSTALLHGAAELASQTGWILSVAHVHHGWRGREADRDLLFVAGLSRRLGLHFFSRHRDSREESRRLALSPEAGARRVRYEALLDMAREAGAGRIATAHQRDDRIESHLLARRRKGGLASLAGPRESRADGVVRPLLSVTRVEIRAFLAARSISFRRDASNGDLRFDRNRLRREISRLDGREIEAIARRVDRLARLRDRVDGEFEASIRPAILVGRNVVVISAALLQRSTAELRRLAVLECAARFSVAGKPPVTGRERERIVALLAEGADFRFEAGRLIRFRRRGERFEVSARAAAKGRKKGNNRGDPSVILGDRRELLV
jgi:tRNA(Ile)-lysidine synthetase-like protein